MGFFDIITKGIEVVRGLIVNPPPFVKTIEKYAGIVAHGIPFLGPALDVAAPALDAIFSTVPDPLTSKPSSTSEAEPYPIVLKQDKKAMDELLGSFKSYVAESQAVLEKRLVEVAAEIKQAVHEIKEYIDFNEFIKLQGQVELHVHYFSEKRKALEELTAQSGPSKCEEIFGYLKLKDRRDELEKVVNDIRARLAQPTQIPSQAIVDLYLLSIHWLLIYDKAIIVVRGLQIRSYWAWESYASYLRTIGRLHEDVAVLRSDALWARDTLVEFVERVTQKRDDFVSIEATETSVTIATVVSTTTKLSVVDKWKPLGVGWIGIKSVEAAIRNDKVDIVFDDTFPGTEADNARAKKQFQANLMLFQQIARSNLDAHLAPCRAVINGLEDSVSRWDTRLPVYPEKLANGKYHAKPSNKPQVKIAEGQAKSRLAGKDVTYAVTYVNGYGESPESEWSESYVISDEATLEIVLAEVAFKHDPTAGYERIKTKKTLAPRDRGIRRRIYIEYKDDPKDEKLRTEFIGEAAESDLVFIHKLVDDAIVVPGTSKKW